MSLVDLHMLSVAAHLAEQGTKPVAWPAAPASNGCNSMSTHDMDFDEPQSGAGRSVRSSDHHLSRANNQGKHSKHRAAEAKRRERINERLQALRELVPHDQRSNTATFLEGVISYIQNLQQSNAQLEAELASLRAVRAAAAANLEQHELLTQPAASGSNPANSSHQPAVQQHSQHQYYTSSWRQDSITGPPPKSPEAAAAAASAAAAAAQWQQAAAGTTQRDSNALQALQQHLQQQQRQAPGLHAPERHALSSSPPPPYAAATPTAAGPASTTLSAPAALMHTLMANTGTAGASAGAGASGSNSAAVASGSVQAPAPGSLQPPVSAGPSAVQPAELQGVLEKALLAALQQQAQQLATQLLSRGS